MFSAAESTSPLSKRTWNATILSARIGASMPCRSAELTAASPSAMKINVVAPWTMSSALLQAEVQRAPPVDAPNTSVCGSGRGGYHTARSGQKPCAPGGTKFVNPNRCPLPCIFTRLRPWAQTWVHHTQTMDLDEEAVTAASLDRQCV